MLLHAKHTSQDHVSVIIVCDDTDVLVLSIAFSEQIGIVFIRCGNKTEADTLM